MTAFDASPTAVERVRAVATRERLPLAAPQGTHKEFATVVAQKADSQHPTGADGSAYFFSFSRKFLWNLATFGCTTILQ